jgi:hypothetical protein
MVGDLKDRLALHSTRSRTPDSEAVLRMCNVFSERPYLSPGQGHLELVFFHAIWALTSERIRMVSTPTRQHDVHERMRRPLSPMGHIIYLEQDVLFH